MRLSAGFAVVLSMFSFTALFAAAAPRELIPSSAPHGARIIVTGSGLDDPTLILAFPNSSASVILTRAATLIEAVVPPLASSGDVMLTANGAVLATFPFTLLPDPTFVRTATVLASQRAHDIFSQPFGAAVVTSSGMTYVADTQHNQIKSVSADGRLLSTIGSGSPGLTDGPAVQAQFKQPQGVAFDVARQLIYVADTGNNAIRRITIDGVVSTFVTPQAGLKQPTAIAIDANGNLFVADSGNSQIRLISPIAAVNTFAGGVQQGFADGPLLQALFKQPTGIVVDSSGTLYVADAGNNRIRKIAAGVVSTLAGTGHGALIDGPASIAEFKRPSGIAVDDAGNVFVGDTDNNAIRKISGGVVSTIAGNGNSGYVDGVPASSLFNQPFEVDAHGALVVADSYNDALRTIYAAVRAAAVWPRRGPLDGGNMVRIFGTGFVPGATQVTFGGVAATAVTFLSSTELEATVPTARLGSVDVKVSTAAGTDTLAGAYTYLPPPTIATIQPHKGKTAGGDSVMIIGTNFVDGGDTSVTIGGAPAMSVVVTSSTSLTVITPPGAAGAVDVGITTPGGVTTKSGGFVYFAPPVITAFVPLQGSAGTSVAITGQNFDPDASGDQVAFGGVSATATNATATQIVANVPNSASTGKISVTTAGGTAQSSTDFVVATFTGLRITTPATALDVGTSVQFNALGILITGGGTDVTSKASWSSNAASVSVTSTGIVRALSPGSADITAVFSGFSATLHVTSNAVTLPPDPASVATKPDPTVVVPLSDEVRFLYSGPNAIQTGVAANAISGNSASIVRGTVRISSGSPLPGVRITALSHPELGQTLSRADGMFDFAINAGGSVALRFDKAGYISAQRSASLPWNQQTTLADVMLIEYDPQVTEINMAAAGTQVARASVSSDGDGSRQATLIVAGGTTAVLAFPDGSTQPAPTLHIRATEFTVGPSGSHSMPAILPPNSAYTYCVELSADEAVASGAEVRFSKPLAFYSDNFLGFPVGTIVPVGSYDRRAGTWVPADNGVVLKILSISNGAANIDLNGDGLAETSAALAAIGIDDAERQTLATQYAAGQTLWRVAVPHFSPFDSNFSTVASSSASPNQPQPATTPAPSNQNGSGCTIGSSLINCYAASLYESIPITGTPFSLEYDSSRVSPAQNSMTVFLSGATMPAGLKRIDLTISIAGRSQSLSFAPQPNMTYEFTWDGLDAYGRRVQGTRDAGVTLSYVYDSTYALPTSGGRAWNQIGSQASGVKGRADLISTQNFTVRLGHFDVTTAGFGGWTFSAQQFYDGRGGAIYDVGGGQRSGDPAQTKQLALSTYAGNGKFGSSGDGGPARAASLAGPNYIAVGADGSLYISEYMRIRRVDSQTGVISTVAGNGFSGSTPDGALALGNPIAAFQVSVGPDGTLYFVDGNRVRRIVNGELTTVAGNGNSGFAAPPDGASATQVAITPEGIAVGNDGTVYIALPNGIIRVSQDGLISNYSALRSVLGIGVGPDGALYAVGVDGTHAYKISSTGTTIIGGVLSGSTSQPLTDGQPATSGSLCIPATVAAAADGTVLVAETCSGAPRVRAIGTDGIAMTLIGTGQYPPFNVAVVDGALARATPAAPWGIAIAPDGSVYVMDVGLNIVRRAAGVFPPAQHGLTAIPSPDGSAAYLFQNGRHTSTVDTLTGVTLQTLGYDTNGFLTSVTDLDGNVTTIERSTDGSPTAIVAPGGQRTTLQTAGGHLTSVINPANEEVDLAYNNPAGLLTDLTDPRKGVHHMTYNAQGLVTRDDGPDGSFFSLTKSGTGQNYSVMRTTAEGRIHVYKVQLASDAAATRQHTEPDGTFVKETFAAATTTTIASDGSSQTLTDSPDPRFGMIAPFTGSATLSGGGHTSTLSFTRAVTPDSITPFAVASSTETLTVNGQKWVTTYAESARMSLTTSPAGRTVSTTLDAKGRLASLSQPGVASLTLGYTTFGALASVQHGSRTTSFGYDSRQQLTSITDALHRTVGFSYDDAGRLTTQTLPDSRVIKFGYDASGNVVSVTPPSRPNHLFTLTPGELVSSYTPPSSAATQYAYNLDRQLTGIVRPDGSTVGLTWDGFGRGTTLSIARGKYLYSYDPATGQLHSVSAPDGTMLTYAYTGPLLSTISWSGTVGGSVSFGYDNFLRLANETVAGSSISFTYDLDGLLTAAGALTVARDKQNGLLTGSTLGAISDAWTFNGFAEPLTYAATASGNALFSQQVARNDAGQIEQKSESILGESHTYTYAYDTAGRLSGVTTDGIATTTYTYDGNGNRLPGTYDDQDRMLSYGGATYTYTAGGDLASKTDLSGLTSYIYDELGNLMHVSLPSGNVIEYVIDGQNRRVGKKVNGVLLRQWLYADQVRIVAELDGAGALLSRFVYGSRANVPDYMIKGATIYRIISDHLGSPRLVVESTTGSVAQWLDYDAFGVVTNDTNPGFQPFGFAGGLYDPDTQLVRFGARDYDVHTGRWTAKDPILFGSDVNLYGYAFTDPVNWADIDGRRPGDPYKSRDAAAQAAISEICGISSDIEREFGGYIYRRPDGSFSYTPQLHGYKYDMRNLGTPSAELPKGVAAVGSYHTHVYDSTGFHNGEEISSNDQYLSHRLGIPAYVGTPSGRILRYNPYPNSSDGYQTQIGRCNCSPVKPNGPEYR